MCSIVLLCNVGRQQTIASLALDLAHSSYVSFLPACCLLFFFFCQTQKSSGIYIKNIDGNDLHVNNTPPPMPVAGFHGVKRGTDKLDE